MVIKSGVEDAAVATTNFKWVSYHQKTWKNELFLIITRLDRELPLTTPNEKCFLTPCKQLSELAQQLAELAQELAELAQELAPS